MSETNYAPRPLTAAREYPGYQFYTVLTLEGHSAADCLRYAAFVVQNWLCERLRKAGNEVPEALLCPAAVDYEAVPDAALKSCRLSFTEIVALPERGMWSLTVREPDPEIAARSFVTRVGLRTGGEAGVEFGVSVDVVDRDETLPEIDKAYRPQFVRLLFETKGMTLTQAEPLPFREAETLSDKKGLRRLLSLIDSRDNQLPIVVFTHAERSRPNPTDLNKLVEAIRNTQAIPPRPGFPSAASQLLAAISAPQEPFLPYDAAELARHVYGFARVFILAPALLDGFRARFNRAAFRPGDCLVIEPRPFGRQTKVLPYREGLDENWHREKLQELQEELSCYSKRKPCSFGGVLFGDEARQIQREAELDAIRASVHLERSEELREMLNQLEEERERGAELVQHIKELRGQLRDEYQRGVESAAHHAALLEEQLDQSRAEIAELESKTEGMRPAFEEARSLRGVIDIIREIPRLPQTCEDVAAFFRQVFPDRIDFTERGLKSAARCEINPELLWEALYLAATALTELHRAGGVDVEKCFREQTGWEVSMHEGANTHAVPSYMNLRKDTYEGREISAEPHLKFTRSSRKTGASYQRLYYAYDPQTRKVIVSYVGDHLDNYSTLSFH
ncbi:MAG: hypothetical protein IKP40_05505 [Clostridia bacterium]|nr:hypothetical protein [Clostridia bacterium]